MNKVLIPLTLIFAIITISCKKKTDDSKMGQSDQTQMTVDSAYFATVAFPSIDLLDVTADVYHIHKDSSVMVLCHQAGWSRGEYKEIAPKLNALGYNCIAIDQRSGNAINGVANETSKRAKAAGKGTTYNDSKQDIIAAVNYAAAAYSKKVYLWGSSYSSSLVLIVAKENDNIHTVLSFSPGEYLSPVNVNSSIKGLNKPAFLTSSKSESADTKKLYDVITSSDKVQFIPNGNGEHGSRALWSDKVDQAEYWTALKAFLGE